MSSTGKRKNYYYDGYSPRYTETVKNVYKHDLKGEVKLLNKFYYDSLFKDNFKNICKECY
jgi:hypothetical protein